LSRSQLLLSASYRFI